METKLYWMLITKEIDDGVILEIDEISLGVILSIDLSYDVIGNQWITLCYK